MVELSRRSFIAGAAAIPFALWLEKYAGAQPSPGLVRYEATTTQGQAMLREYAQAVAKMTQTPPGDPRSWVFQWYTHFVNGATTKDAEISRIFGATPGANGNLAGEMWNTCQAHDQNEDENYFLPWHRMFVYFFERIVRSVAGDSSFTLPYWNYSTSDPNSHGVIPAQFRNSGDATFGALFRSNRNPGVNDGQPIDQGQPGDGLGLSVLGQGSYGPDGAADGFNQGLDFGLHGFVHVQIGDSTGMGQIPTAANDPVFWMHHCNIDRLWASWNVNGGLNPGGSWLTQQFVFADENGKRVAATVQDFVDLGKLNYSYDRLEPAPAGFRPLARTAIGQKPAALLARVAGPLTLGASPASANLESAKPGVAFHFPRQVKSLLPAKRLYLVMRNLSAEIQPGVIYHVYLDLAAGTTPKKDDPHHVGMLNFFGAAHHHATVSAAPSNLTPRFVSMDVTSVARALQSQGTLSQNPAVTVVPVGKPAEPAKPVIGEITLVAQ